MVYRKSFGALNLCSPLQLLVVACTLCESKIIVIEKLEGLNRLEKKGFIKLREKKIQIGPRVRLFFFFFRIFENYSLDFLISIIFLM